MTAKSQLPVPLNNGYFEPLIWLMPCGPIYVSELTAAEQQDPRFAHCVFVAKTATGQELAAFQYVSDALTALTVKGYEITWLLVRGKQIDLSVRGDDG